MNTLNPAAVKQMAATCVALPLLLSGDRKMRDLNFIGGIGSPEVHSELIGREAKLGRSTLIVTFILDGAEALIDKMLFFNAGSKKKQSLSISYCSFVQSEDGRFALRLVGREQPTESVFSRSSKRLVSRRVNNDAAWATAELAGLQALLAKAATPECHENARLVVQTSR